MSNHIKAEIVRLMREEFDPCPPNYRGYSWHDCAEEVADSVVALFASPQTDLLSRAEVLRVIRSLGEQDADLAMYGAADNARAREYGEAAATRACCAIALMPPASPSPAPAAVEELVARLVAVADLLGKQDERQTKLHELLETIREQIRVGVPPEYRPEGLFQNIQDAVYAMRGRMPLLNDAAITSPLTEAATALSTLAADKARVAAERDAALGKLNAVAKVKHYLAVSEVEDPFAKMIDECEAAEARATAAEAERDEARAELDDGMRDYDGGYEAGQSDAANAVEAAEARASALEGEVERLRGMVEGECALAEALSAAEARASALEGALVKIERLGSDGEHSGDRHAQCRAIAQSALAASRKETP